MTACSCLRAQTDVNIKRNGKAVITAEVLMDDEAVKENYGMPTNFYDAVEGDYRFSRVTSWDKQYTSEQYDGLNYIGVKITKEAEKKEVGDALSALYGDYAKINYEDSNLFGNRTIKIKVYGNGNHLQEERPGRIHPRHNACCCHHGGRNLPDDPLFPPHLCRCGY